MVWTAKRGNVLLTALAAILMSSLGAGRAEAQWGMGFGIYGGGFVPQVQQPGDFLNQVALARVSRGGGGGGGQNNPYAGNPNSYFNHVRDNGFVEQYNVYRREPSYYRYPPSGQGLRMTATAMTIARSKPVVPLSSFYDTQNQLVWPGDAPSTSTVWEHTSAPASWPRIWSLGVGGSS